MNTKTRLECPSCGHMLSWAMLASMCASRERSFGKGRPMTSAQAREMAMCRWGNISRKATRQGG